MGSLLARTVGVLGTLLLYGPLALGHSSRSHLFFVPVYPCTEIGVGTDLSERSFAGILGGTCVDRRSANGEPVRHDVENTFFRFRFEGKYSLGGSIWQSGWRMSYTVGPETNLFRSDVGSKASVSFLVTAAHITYLFRPWRQLTLEIGAGYGYLQKMHSQMDIVANESSPVREYLRRNTKSNHHPGLLVNLGLLI